MVDFSIRAASVAIGLVVATALASSRAAVQTPQGQPPIFRGVTNAVRVDVTVTNRAGEPVTDLTRDDFFLTEDGAPQTIDSCELVRVTGEECGAPCRRCKARGRRCEAG